MAETHTPEDYLPEGPVADEPDLQPTAADSGPVETRGARWIVVPAVLGVLLGAVIGLVQALRPVPQGEAQELLLGGAAQGAVVGLIAGGVFGLLVWVLFPYKGRNPHAPQVEQEAKAAPEGEAPGERGASAP